MKQNVSSVVTAAETAALRFYFPQNISRCGMEGDPSPKLHLADIISDKPRAQTILKDHGRILLAA